MSIHLKNGQTLIYPDCGVPENLYKEFKIKYSDGLQKIKINDVYITATNESKNIPNHDKKMLLDKILEYCRVKSIQLILENGDAVFYPEYGPDVDLGSEFSIVYPSCKKIIVMNSYNYDFKKCVLDGILEKPITEPMIISDKVNK